MRLNLIPASPNGVSYGEWTLELLMEKFKKQILGVVIILDREKTEFYGNAPSVDGIQKADFEAVIVLIRELYSVGMITGFIVENGLNIRLSGMGGALGKQFLDFLKHVSI